MNWATGGIVLCLIVIGIWAIVEWRGARRDYRRFLRRERARTAWKSRVVESQTFWRNEP